MSKQMYRGYKVVANDNAAVVVRTKDTVYRGARYRRDEQKLQPTGTTGTRKFYRGVKAA